MQRILTGAVYLTPRNCTIIPSPYNKTIPGNRIILFILWCSIGKIEGVAGSIPTGCGLEHLVTENE